MSLVVASDCFFRSNSTIFSGALATNLSFDSFLLTPARKFSRCEISACIFLISASLSIKSSKRTENSVVPTRNDDVLGLLYFTLMIFDRHANLKYKYGSRHFWCRGYYVDTVGRNEKVIQEYIRNQTEEDCMADQISFKEYMDPFTGSKNK